MSGGGQERGFRSGTLPANLVIGLGTACEICSQEMEVLNSCIPLYFYMICILNSVLCGIRKELKSQVAT